MKKTHIINNFEGHFHTNKKNTHTLRKDLKNEIKNNNWNLEQKKFKKKTLRKASKNWSILCIEIYMMIINWGSIFLGLKVKWNEKKTYYK